MTDKKEVWKDVCSMCKEENDPVRDEAVKNAWVDKDDVAHFEYVCPKCRAIQTLDIPWD